MSIAHCHVRLWWIIRAALWLARQAHRVPADFEGYAQRFLVITPATSSHLPNDQSRRDEPQPCRPRSPPARLSAPPSRMSSPASTPSTCTSDSMVSPSRRGLPVLSRRSRPLPLSPWVPPTSASTPSSTRRSGSRVSRVLTTDSECEFPDDETTRRVPRRSCTATSRL